jgi:hypothetical protein
MLAALAPTADALLVLAAATKVGDPYLITVTLCIPSHLLIPNQCFRSLS